MNNYIKGVAQYQTFNKFSEIIATINAMLRLLFSHVSFIMPCTKTEQSDGGKPVLAIGSYQSVQIISQRICHMVMLK